jgi:hypothetical protein
LTGIFQKQAKAQKAEMLDDIKAKDNVKTDYSDVSKQKADEVSNQVSTSANKKWEANREALIQSNRERTAMLRQKIYGGEEVLFGQRRVGRKFRDDSDAPDYLRGRSIYDVASDLKSGKIKPNQIRIEAFEHQGKLVAATNRGLAALSLAGFKPTNILKRVASEDELNRLKDTPFKNQVLPGTKTYVTPGRNNMTILDEINLPNF